MNLEICKMVEEHRKSVKTIKNTLARKDMVLESYNQKEIALRLIDKKLYDIDTHYKRIIKDMKQTHATGNFMGQF